MCLEERAYTDLRLESLISEKKKDESAKRSHREKREEGEEQSLPISQSCC